MGILGGGSTSYYDKLLESATSQLNLEPNWAAILEICDTIRQKDVPAKYALASMKKKIFDKNPHVSRFALNVLEACMKNCGALFQDEVATRDFMEELRGLIKNGTEEIKSQVLAMVQTWNFAFRNKAGYKVFQDTYNLLKIEGHTFPEIKEADAMFSADNAPEWAEGDVCHMCRVKFSTFTRQHHCRCCGQVFCAKCSSKMSIIPKYGIEREVRVCDPCYDQLNPQSASGEGASAKASPALDENGLPSEYLNHPLSKEEQTTTKTDADTAKAQEEEELQLAMALSLSAAEVEKRASSASGNWTAMASPVKGSSAPPIEKVAAGTSQYNNSSISQLTSTDADANPELSRYLNRAFWEEKKQSFHPSAPVAMTSSDAPVYASPQNDEPAMLSSDQNGDSSDAFVNTVQSSLDMFVDRMQMVTSKGRHIAMDQTVQSLFQSLTAMHPQLIRLIEDEEDQKVKYEAMLEKVSLIREARESLDDMRKQHSEKLRQQELEQEMLRRMQMEQKLELMRQQKQEYLEYQHQLQLQRQQELDVQQQYKMQQKQFAAAQFYSQGMPPPAGAYQGEGQSQQGPFAGQLPEGSSYSQQQQYAGGQVGYSVAPSPQGAQPAVGGYPTAYDPQQKMQEPRPAQFDQPSYAPMGTEQYNAAMPGRHQQQQPMANSAMDRPTEQPPQHPTHSSSMYQGYENQGQPLDMKSMRNALPPNAGGLQGDYPTGRVSPYQYQPNQTNSIAPQRNGLVPQSAGVAVDQYSAGGNQSVESHYPAAEYAGQGYQQHGAAPGVPMTTMNGSLQPQMQQQQGGLQTMPVQPQQQQQGIPPAQTEQSQFTQQQQVPMATAQVVPQQTHSVPPQMPQQQQHPQPQQYALPQQQQQQFSPPHQQLPYAQPQQILQQPHQIPQQPQQQYEQSQQPYQPQGQPDIPASSHIHDMQLISFD